MDAIELKFKMDLLLTGDQDAALEVAEKLTHLALGGDAMVIAGLEYAYHQAREIGRARIIQICARVPALYALVEQAMRREPSRPVREIAMLMARDVARADMEPTEPIAPIGHACLSPDVGEFAAEPQTMIGTLMLMACDASAEGTEAAQAVLAVWLDTLLPEIPLSYGLPPDDEDLGDGLAH